MPEIKIDKDKYEPFSDYKDVMVEAFGIGCSLCGNQDIAFVLKGHPQTIGNLLKDAGELTDDEVDKLIAKPVDEWQKFDDDNSDKNIPVFLCEECWNTFD